MTLLRRTTPSLRRGRVSGLRVGAIAALVVVLVGTGTLAANAIWNASTFATTTAVAAKPGVSVEGLGELDVDYTNGPSPVTMDTAAITVTNTGTTPLTYSLSVSGGVSDVSLSVWLQGSTCNKSTTPAAGVTIGTLAAPPALPANASSANATVAIALCVRTEFTGDFAARNGTSITPTLTVTGRVGTNWSTSAGGSFKQTFTAVWYQVINKSDGLCLTAPSGDAPAGTLIVLRTCQSPASTTSNQSFRFADVGSGDSHIIIGNAGGSTAVAMRDFPDFTLEPANVNANSTYQKWQIEQHGAAGDYRIKNVYGWSELFGEDDVVCMVQTSTTTVPETTGVLETDVCDDGTDPSDAAYKKQHFILVAVP